MDAGPSPCSRPLVHVCRTRGNGYCGPMAHLTAGSIAATALQKAASAVAAVFLLVGVLGFVPGVTTDYDSTTFAGTESEALLLGIFQVSVLHNVVHLLFGVAGFALARSWSGARSFLIGGGAVYLVLWVYGLAIDLQGAANFVPVNNADNWLHLALGLGMVLLGAALGRSDSGVRGGTLRS